jgi:hypothetical protein
MCEIRPKIVIHNGSFAYELVIFNGERISRIISFTGFDNADYFAYLYKQLGYDVRRSGDGSENYLTWVQDHGEIKGETNG